MMSLHMKGGIGGREGQDIWSTSFQMFMFGMSVAVGQDVPKTKEREQRRHEKPSEQHDG